MKKMTTLMVLFGIFFLFNTNMDAMRPPYIDNFIHYQAFLKGVDTYLFDEDFYFEDSEIDMHDEYFISYQIEHRAYNQKEVQSGGEARMIYQSKDPLKNYHFQVLLYMRPGDEIMQMENTDLFGEGYYTLIGDQSRVSIEILNANHLPETEILRLFQAITTLYGKTMEVSK